MSLDRLPWPVLAYKCQEMLLIYDECRVFVSMDFFALGLLYLPNGPRTRRLAGDTRGGKLKILRASLEDQVEI